MAAVAEGTGGATITATTSPLMPRNKTGRLITVGSVCDLNEAEKMHRKDDATYIQPQCMTSKMKEDDAPCSEAREKKNTNASYWVSADVKRSDTDNKGETPHLVQENQAIKRQKLEGEKTRQILQIKPQSLPHKSKLGLTTSNTNISINTNQMHKDDRKGYASQIQMTPKHKLIKPMENPWKPHLTEPKTLVFQTSIRARPPKKSSVELELEELEKIPKFKARPLNKKIFESKGDIGVFCNAKKQVTEPKEFHFATHERIPPPAVADFFDLDKLSLKSECTHKKKPIPRNTIPKPFHFHTKERGAEKEKKLVMELQHKQLEEEISRIPKANPWPYTTDYPHVPQKTESKQCTKAEPFQLESLVRHEEEMNRQMEEQLIVKRDDVQMSVFKAQPILKEDPILVTVKVRKPLTQVQELNLHADSGAVTRAQFDEKEKEMVYKRFREENEATRMVKEEKALKQLRRTMIPQVRPAPKFDHPFCPQKSARDTTNPKSPNLHVAQRIERRKISNDSVISSPAARMR